MLNESGSLENLPLEELELVDAACDSVNQAWHLGEPTRIKELVAKAPESLQRLMLIELVRTEVELRVASGEQPTAAEYIELFPQWQAELQQCVDSSLSTPQAGVDPNCIKAISNRFEVLGLLGRGGMGIVVRAKDLKLEREVAVKLLAQDLARDPYAKQRFLREARLAAAVRHDNIVTIYSADEIGGVALIEMELVEGDSLSKRIQRQGALATSSVIHIATQIASGLEAAHARGMIHRDIKPANILIEDSVRDHSVRVKITDFGLARAASEASITRTGIVVGTPQYISPEQAEALPLDHRTDLFSLGSVIYSMCTGRTAFQAPSIISILRLVADGEPTPIAQLNPSIPPWLIAVVEKLMAKRPADRFQSATELIEALTKQDSKEQTVVLVPRSRHWQLVIPAVAILVVVLFGCSIWYRMGMTNKLDEGTDVAFSRRVAGGNSDQPEHPLVSGDYEWSMPVRLGPAINTEVDEENACISSDGLGLIFNRISANTKVLFESRRDNVNAMFEPAQVISAEFNKQNADGPYLSYDGFSLYYGLVLANESISRDLWVSKRNSKSEPWGPAINLGPNVNTSSIEQSPWVSRDGLTLIFSRTVNANFKLFEAVRSSEQEEFTSTKELANINGGDCSSFPRLTQDGLVILFVHCPSGSKNVGLWIAKRDSIQAEFSRPVELDPRVNAFTVTSGPALSSDEMTIYYSTREHGKTDFDLWSISRVPKK